MRKSLLAAVLALPFLLAGCGGTSLFGSPEERVEGYAELKASLCTETSATYNELECARLTFDESLSAYLEAQDIILAAVNNPDLPAEAKTGLKEVDATATSALRSYGDALAAGSPERDALLLATVAALQEVQAKLVELQLK